MVQTKMELFSVIFCFVVVTVVAVEKIPRDVSHLGYLYDKPTQVLEIPENQKEVVNKSVQDEIKTEEAILAENPQRKPLDDYLPPKNDPLNLPAKETLETIENEEISKALTNRKRESVKTKNKGNLLKNLKGKETSTIFLEHPIGNENIKGKIITGNKAVLKS